jgi:hypothetical protein
MKMKASAPAASAGVATPYSFSIIILCGAQERGVWSQRRAATSWPYVSHVLGVVQGPCGSAGVREPVCRTVRTRSAAHRLGGPGG